MLHTTKLGPSFLKTRTTHSSYFSHHSLVWAPISVFHMNVIMLKIFAARINRASSSEEGKVQQNNTEHVGVAVVQSHGRAAINPPAGTNLISRRKILLL